MRPALQRRGFIECIRCDGTGHRVECFDDLCHTKGRCMHGGNRCKLCGGCGIISTELADRWRARESFRSVEVPDRGKRLRGITDEH